MTDGDSAKPGRRRVPESDTEVTGSHHTGINVADLIARVTGAPANLPTSEPESDVEPDPESAAEPESAADPEAAAAPEPESDPATEVLRTASEIPDLTAIAQRADQAELAEQARWSEWQQYSPAALPPADPAPELFGDPAFTAPPPSLPASNLPPANLPPANLPPNLPAPTSPPARPLPVVKTHRRRPILLAGRSLAALFAVLALVLTGAAWQWTATKNHRLNKVAALDPDSRDIVDPNAQFGDENFLIVGVDSRYGENSGMGAGDTADAGGARSDSVILVNIPADRKRVVAVSFPRDLAITPVECQAWDPATREYGPVYDEETGTYSPNYRYTETKLNSAYAFGGPKCLVKVVQKISGLKVNRFIAIDFAGFSKMVDAVGGVDVCTPTPLVDYELGTVLEHAGHQRIDGHTALNYVRARQVTTEVNGDYGRIKRQQLFLSSLLRSMISSETFFSINKLNNVVNTFIDDSYVDNVDTKDLVDLGQSVQGIAAGRITFITLPTTGITDEDGNEEPYVGAIDALFQAVRDDQPLPGENDTNETTTPITSSSTSSEAASSTEPTSTTTTTPEERDTSTSASSESTEVVNATTTNTHEVSVHVANSTQTAGLGSRATADFAAHGFSVDDPDDYSKNLHTTTVQYSPGNEAAAVTVAAALGNPKLERTPGLGDQIQVVLGEDFVSVGDPLAPGSPVEVQVSHKTPVTTTAELPAGLELTNAADVSCE
ncbi:LCP family glycopolymer transferase [Mycolicibacterium brumae]|uniref:Transcriptional regulator n=1 Tax=Mycolicibacterium brumae TaxID=85968 RepID=A0A2G5P7Q9_9MYCO|nr:LCP family protein [Mycolicibacterium brumae]MCV7194084.1 LCP family protein [Mycolicibacterium brumae]PIB74401.1 transcriptional regulator [Mycolicibacterium brumae]RWA22745.1 hypothetical protein MBRU_12425 [Mycolicibacterium brumae DSM 44177]UWW07450.1 LCP family protein [Mycolicibacterium brumae]